MKRFRKESVILSLQLLLFYVLPLFAGPTDTMGMVFLILTGTLLLSALIGTVSRNRIKFLYPLAAAILFLPSVPIYYNGSAAVHALWYFVVSTAGLLFGVGLRMILLKAAKK